MSAFQRAVATFKRIDYVFPIAGIGEKRWLPPTNENGSAEAEFVEPHLSVLDVDLKGVLYTVALAVQQFKRQEVDRLGFRGKSEYYDLPIYLQYFAVIFIEWRKGWVGADGFEQSHA